jgi:hypothetical protein
MGGYGFVHPIPIPPEGGFPSSVSHVPMGMTEAVFKDEAMVLLQLIHLDFIPTVLQLY